jgi:sugar phosphate isomerase/epimerase
VLARHFIDVAHALGTDTVQIPSNDDKNAIGNERIIVTELHALADLGKQALPLISFAYEAMAWSTHINR